jgi:hypothetical protein
MIIKSVRNLKFKDNKGVYSIEGKCSLALYEEDKGFISIDGGHTPYVPAGGRKALNTILEMGGFIGEVDYIQPLA